MSSLARPYRSFIGAIALISLIVCLAIEWYGFEYIPSPNTQTVEVYIPPGSSIHEIADILHAAGVLARPRAFVLMTRLENSARALKAGEYLIPSTITPGQLMRFLVAGKGRLREITFVEGWRFAQMLESIQQNPYLQHNLQNKTPQDIMALLGEPDKNPEGLFYPETFKFSRGTSDLVVLKQSYDLMSQTSLKIWAGRAPDLPYETLAEALIVASLIEKETAVEAERSEIAGVIARRLRLNMPLQIDPTVIYGLGDAYSGHLSKDDLKVNSPYNTYRFKGLPPTPIAMPGLGSLAAAVHPAQGDALYYVSKGDGSHQFSSTLKAHQLAVAELRRRLATSIKSSDGSSRTPEASPEATSKKRS